KASPPRRQTPRWRSPSRLAVSAPGRHGYVPVTQLLLEHWDRRSGLALVALGDGDGGRVADREAAAPVPKANVPERLDERLAIGLVAHRRLGVAARGEGQARDHGGDRGGEDNGFLHGKHLSWLAGNALVRPGLSEKLCIRSPLACAGLPAVDHCCRNLR